MSKQRRQPIHYGFISIDEECCASSSTSQHPQEDEDPPSFTLLQQFYNELMIPTFPIEDERDDIQDWYTCFKAQMKVHQHRINVKRQTDIKNVLTDGLKEEGIATKVQHFQGEDDEVSGDQFDGPAMDVILMVQDYDSHDDYDDEKVYVGTNAGNENTREGEHGIDNKGKYFFQRSSTSFLLGSQTSLYGGLYSPNDEEVEDDDGAHSSASSIKRASWRSERLLRNQSTSTIFEDEENANKSSGGDDDDDEDAGNFSATNRCFVPRRKSSLVRVRENSLYGGLYAPDAEESAQNNTKQHVTIIGGAAVEYYKQSRVGLLSYVVLHNQYRGCGLAKVLHEEALLRLEMLAANYNGSSAGNAIIPQHVKDLTTITSELELSNNMNNVNKEESLIRAIFAETNTPSAGDVTHEQSLLRHQSLYNLGYRLVKFPYAQPPLTTEDVDASFNDIVLLVYFPLCDYNQIQMMNKEDYSDNNVMTNEVLIRRYCPWFNPNEEVEQHHSVRMSIDIPFKYIEDFYQSVFGYSGNSATERENIDHELPNYRIAKYYKFVHWFACCREDTKRVDVTLCRPVTPWEDCKKDLLLQFEEWKSSNNEDHMYSS